MSDFLMVLGQTIAQLIASTIIVISLIAIVMGALVARADKNLRRPKRK